MDEYDIKYLVNLSLFEAEAQEMGQEGEWHTNLQLQNWKKKTFYQHVKCDFYAIWYNDFNL